MMTCVQDLSAAELAQVEGGLLSFSWGAVNVSEIVITKVQDSASR
jgi:hypothetical protein